jgi:hypothetical protein
LPSKVLRFFLILALKALSGFSKQINAYKNLLALELSRDISTFSMVPYC